MKFFIDTANIEEIKKAWELGVIDGVTTNPSLISKEKREPTSLLREICHIVAGPVSAEAMSLKADEIVEEAEGLAKIHDNIVVKIPMTEDGLMAVKRLSAGEIETNVTLVFSPSQALLAAKAGATYVSLFVGRLDDISHTGMGIAREVREIFKNYLFDAEIIVASIRNPIHVVEVAKIGADIATIPYSVITKLTRHPLTDIGIKNFLSDWEEVKGK
ncbi:fructose-6-phosphate aldolase [Thermodesulfovibrionales bacterium]|nr:fructose-6-phosphate aldolase [Thermodesulfovibrionales bacterium]MCL0066975.1 fructose-6-phosphate aldolase [Thermodesulfovibrionales bacterium]